MRHSTSNDISFTVSYQKLPPTYHQSGREGLTILFISKLRSLCLGGDDGRLLFECWWFGACDIRCGQYRIASNSQLLICLVRCLSRPGAQITRVFSVAGLIVLEPDHIRPIISHRGASHDDSNEYIPQVELQVLWRQLDMLQVHVEIIQPHRTAYLSGHGQSLPSWSKFPAGHDSQVWFFNILSKLNAGGMFPRVEEFEWRRGCVSSLRETENCLMSTWAGFLYHCNQEGYLKPISTDYSPRRRLSRVCRRPGRCNMRHYGPFCLGLGSISTGSWRVLPYNCTCTREALHFWVCGFQ